MNKSAGANVIKGERFLFSDNSKFSNLKKGGSIINRDSSLNMNGGVLYNDDNFDLHGSRSRSRSRRRARGCCARARGCGYI